jgi:hypothetical protein
MREHDDRSASAGWANTLGLHPISKLSRQSGLSFILKLCPQVKGDTTPFSAPLRLSSAIPVTYDRSVTCDERVGTLHKIAGVLPAPA